MNDALAPAPPSFIVALDDTDSRDGMCTTYLGAVAIERLTRGAAEDGGFSLALRGYPKLVRLNPNIPWKTRGNGAVAFHLLVDESGYSPVSYSPVTDPPTRDRARQLQRLAGEMSGRAIEMPPHLPPVIPGGNSSSGYPRSHMSGFPGGILDFITATMESLFDRFAQSGSSGTDPAFAVFASPPPVDFYLEALHGVVEIDAARDYARKHALAHRPYKNGRGLVGSCAAAAFTGIKTGMDLPSRLTDRTYEIITYREEGRWGTPRRVTMESVERMAVDFPETFENLDRRNGHMSVAPNSPCPILTGVRADSPSSLREASSALDTGEPESGWMIFETNQATDAHILEIGLDAIEPYRSVRIAGVVSSMPREIKGGHVIFRISDPDDDAGPHGVDCAAYEPTKEFREIVRALRPGDRLEVFGGIRESPVTINLEKVLVKELVRIEQKISNPVCGKCGKRMKSAGAGEGFRCRRCGERSPGSSAEYETLERVISPGWYETPSCARRHLVKPLERMRRAGEIIARDR